MKHVLVAVCFAACSAAPFQDLPLGIDASDVSKAAGELRRATGQAPPSEPALVHAWEKRARDELIDARLIERAASEQGVTVDAATLEAEVARIRERSHSGFAAYVNRRFGDEEGLR